MTDPDIMWDWLRAYGTPLYDTFWITRALKEYEFIYHKSVEQELVDMNVEDGEEVARVFKEQLRNAEYHFGERHLNTATIAGVIKMTLKKNYTT